ARGRRPCAARARLGARAGALGTRLRDRGGACRARVGEDIRERSPRLGGCAGEHPLTARRREARLRARGDRRARRHWPGDRLGASAVIETERLLLRRPRTEDAPGLLEAFADPEAMRFIGDGSTTDLAGAEQAVSRWLERWDAWQIGMCVIERRED